MRRYESKIEAGRVYVETDDEWLEIGSMADIQDLLGGETYSVEYSEKAELAAWLDLENDHSMQFDVRETIIELEYPQEVIAEFAGASTEPTAEQDVPERTRSFAELLMAILEGEEPELDEIGR